MNSRTRSWLLALAFMVFCVHPAMAATYFVRNDGSDANTGLANTAAAAWTTIQHAADLAAPGDEILIQSGTYNEVIFISRPGTATQPIVYRGVGEVYVRGFDFANSKSGLPYPPVVSYYLTLEHLRFRGEWTPARTDYVESGIRLTGVGDITITECSFASLYKAIYANPNYYTGSNRINITNCRFIGNKDGISLSLDSSVTVAGGVFLHNDIGLFASGTYNVVATHGFFQGNRIGAVMSGGNPFYGLQGQNNTIRRSLFTSNTTGVLIGTEVTNSGVCYNDSVVNSTFHANTGSGILIKTKVPNSSPQHLHNNIFLSNGGYGISNESGEALDVGYSLAWNNALGVASGVTLDAANHSLLADPLLLAPAAGDFRLQEGSPCIDTGNPSYNSDPDTRGAVVDMGAKEFSILDRTAPVSAVTAPVAGAALSGAEVVLAGIAADTGGATLTRVEVSPDGGATWLTATGTASWSYVWTLPAPGSYTLMSRATDSEGNVETPGTGVTVTVAGAPIDLAVVAVMPPVRVTTALLVNNNYTTFSYRLANNGTGNSGGFHVSFYLSTDAVITTADTYVGKVYVPLMRAGSELSGNATVNMLSPLLPAGRYWAGAIVDSDEEVAESDETNNALAGDTVLVGGDDLAVTAVTGSLATAPPGGIVDSVRVTVANPGFNTAYANIGIYLSTDPVITTDDMLLATHEIRDLKPGATAEIVRTVAIPLGLGDGVYYYGAIADYDQKVAEPDELDNALAGNSVTVELARSSYIIMPGNKNLLSGPFQMIAGVAPAGTTLVEVSTDNGLTWGEATDTGVGTWTSWNFPWRIPGPGSYQLVTRFTDSLGLVDQPGAGITVTVGAGTVWYAGTTPPVIKEFDGVVQIDIRYHNIAVRLDGTVWTWGTNTTGQLGDGSILNRPTPVRVNGLTEVSTVAAGEGFSLAVKKDGTLWAWGDNTSGQLGDGTTTRSLTPVLVPGLTNIIQAGGGRNFSVALDADGGVWSWGDNPAGQLGDGTTTKRMPPARITGLSGIVNIAVGLNHTLALDRQGRVWAWGNNGVGQVGDSTTTNRLTPVLITGLPGAVAIAAGDSMSSALGVDGSVRAWGGGIGSILGDTVNGNRTFPVAIDGLESSLRIRSSYDGGVTALRNDGTYHNRTVGGSNLVTVPYPLFGLGSGWYALVLSPVVSVITTPHDVILTPGQPVTVAGLALAPDGSELAGVEVSTDNGATWQQAAGTATFSSTWTPTVPGVYTLLSRAATTTGTVEVPVTRLKLMVADPAWMVRGWGYNDYGQAGNGVFGTNITTSKPVALAGTSVQLAVGAVHSLALMADGTVRAWGRNEYGEMGIGTTSTKVEDPVTVKNLTNIKGIAAGGYFSLALAGDGSVWGWGSNYQGTLGDGTNILRTTPVKANITGVTAIAASSEFALALKTDGTVWAWGNNSTGALGDGTTTNRLVPGQVGGLTGITAIAAGGGHALALKADGTLWTWGADPTGYYYWNGSYSYSYGAKRLAPIQLTQFRDIVAMAAGKDHDLVLRRDGTVWSWGYNSYGEVGDGSTITHLTPVRVAGLAGITAIAAGNATSHALTADGTLYGWGYNNYGQLGDGTYANRTTPVRVLEARPVTGLAAGGNHFLALVQGTGTPLPAASWITAPAAGAVVRGESVTVSGAAVPASGTTITRVEVSLDNGATWQSAAGTTSWSFTWSPATAGTHTITSRVVASDGSYQTRFFPVTFTVDTAPPGTLISMPQPGAVLGGTTLVVAGVVEAGAGEGAGIDRVEISADNGATWIRANDLGAGSWSSWFIRIPFTGHPVGPLTLLARYIDAGGSPESAPAAVTVTRGIGAVWDTSKNPAVLKPGLNGLTEITYYKAIRADGQLLSWGGYSGDGTNMNRLAPVILPGFARTTALAEGSNHVLTLKEDGTLWSWGSNNFGQLGTTAVALGAVSYTPVAVANLSGVVAISAGSSHSHAIKSDGTVWGWGSDIWGQVGNDAALIATVALPVQLPGLTNMVALAAGSFHTLALAADGTVWAWGRNGSGQFGIGTLTDSGVPVKVSGLAGIVAIAAYNDMSAALTREGVLYTWGSQQGWDAVNNRAASALTPLVVALSQPVTAFLGWTNNLAVQLADGSAWQVGQGVRREIDLGTMVAKSYLLRQIPAAAGITTPVSGTVVTTPFATLRGWAVDSTGTGVTAVEFTADNGQTWQPVTGTASWQALWTPAAYGTFTLRTRVTTAGGTTDASDTGTTLIVPNPAWNVWTTGDNSTGQLGFDTGGANRNTPAPIANLTQITAVRTMSYSTIARDSAGNYWGWGNNAYGNLGDGTTTSPRPTPVALPLLAAMTAVETGNTFSLGRKADGTLWAWGYNSSGQLGDATTTSRTTPVQVQGLTGVVAMAGGNSFGLALKNDGTVWAWGYNSRGQLGDGTTTTRTTPVRAGTLTGIVAIAAGELHSLALQDDGTVWAWGENSSGQLGDTTSTARSLPVRASGLTGITRIAATAFNSLAIDRDGRMWAWGQNSNGEQCDGTTTRHTTPIQIPAMTGVKEVFPGYTFTFVQKTDGTVWGCGDNRYGQLGSGIEITSAVPIRLPLYDGATAIAGGSYHSLAVFTESSASLDYYCDNDGDGFTDSTIDGTCTGVNCVPAGCVTTAGTDCNDLTAAVYPGAAELCDGLDNNCNGQVDDGIASQPTSCGVGTCAATGTRSCTGGKLVDTCTPGTPTAEICDGLDNNCNGQVDDGIASQSTSCGVGTCGATGTRSCTGGKLVDTCTPGTPTAEICDGLDNDCDGQVDDGIAIEPTSCGVGACMATGARSCTGGKFVDTCTPGTPIAEICDDGVDNNCDGLTDAADSACRTTANHTYYFPSIKDDDSLGWENYLTVQAKEPVPMEATLKVYDLDGMLQGTFIYSNTTPGANSGTLAPNARVALRPSGIAGGAVEGSVIVETSVPAIASTNCIANFYKGFSIYEAAKVRQVHNFPKAYDGPAAPFYQVYMLAQNIYDYEIDVTVRLFGKTAADPGHGATKTYTVPAHGTLKVRPGEVAPLDAITGKAIDFSGSVVISTDLATPGDAQGPAIPAMCRFEAGSEAIAIYESTVEQPALYFPVIRDGRFGGALDYQNFVTVVNPSATANATITLVLYNKAGIEEARLANTVILPGGKKTWRPSWLTGSLSLPKDFEGSIVVTTDLPVVGQTNTIYPGINPYGADGFDLLEASLPAPTLFFPKVYDNLLGSGIGATHLTDNFVYIQNPDGATRNVVIELYNSNGTLNRSMAVAIAPQATHVFRPKDLVTDGSGIFRGSVRVTEQSGLPVAGGIKYEVHRGTAATSVIEAMTIYRSMGQ